MGCKSSKTAVEVTQYQVPPGPDDPRGHQGGEPAQDAHPPQDQQAADVLEDGDIQVNTSEDIRDKYELTGILGSGSFGQVRKAHLKSNPEDVRAVKVIERDDEEGEWSNKAMFESEVKLLQQLKHEHIVRFYDFYEDVHFLYVVMELCSGGEIFGKILELKRFSEKNAAFVGKQMLKAIAYIHSMKITHRDVKAENFMLSQPSITSQIKMIDFGMACKFVEGEYLAGLCGSPHYLAPELIGQKYAHHTDVWAFGVLMYLLMYGHYPYDAKHPRDIMVKIITESVRWQTKVTLSELGLGFLQRCLEHNPRKRITAAEGLQHPWITQGTVNDKDEESDEAIPAEVIRSAHKRVTATRKAVDPKLDELRSQKLRKIEDDWRKGIRVGNRLGVTNAHMERPEYVRRENKLSTAPSNFRAEEPASAGGAQEAPAEQRGSADPEQQEAPNHNNQRRGRIQTATNPKRLAKFYDMSEKEERNVAELYEERKQQAGPAPVMGGIVPASGGCLPGVPPADA
eukprot:gb/GFBE01083185.1/.p1 GENE.gb/GFBE01083185.1/~~gb/GFBE01083185.1/.p1  ORF type:complete len:512 (+),score=115.76 gb/GFBE01083185.1/:1-1536(+)